MPDQIYAAGPLSAPETYTVPGSQRMIPRACQATFDGTAASGAYVPTLVFTSQAGHVIARVPTSTTVAAGASAEVTWAPFLRGAASAAPSAGANLHWLYAARFSLSILDATSTTVDLDPANGNVSWGNDASGDITLTKHLGFYGPTFNVPGEYLVSSFAVFGQAGAPPAGSQAQCGLTGAAITVGGTQVAPWLSNLAATAYAAYPGRWDAFNLPASYGLTPYQSVLRIGQKTGGTVTGVFAGIFCFKVDDTGSTNF